MSEDIKLIRIETKRPGLSRYRLVVDGQIAGIIEKFIPIPATPSFKQYRFLVTVEGMLDKALYVAVGNTRAEVVEKAAEIARVFHADGLRQFDGGVSALTLVEDLKDIHKKLAKSFAENNGGRTFNHYEHDLSGQRTYVMDKLYALGFDKRVVAALGFGATEKWQQEKVA